MADAYYQQAIADAPYLAAETDDWEIAMLGAGAIALTVGAGWFPFAFRSAKLDVTEGFCLTAAGVGLGGNAAAIGPDTFDNAAFAKIDYLKPFSIAGLHQSAGRIAAVSVGIDSSQKMAAKLSPLQRGVSDKLSYGVCRVTSDSFTTLLQGAGLGSGTGGFSFAGFWYSFTLNANSINPIRALLDLWNHVQMLAAQQPSGDLSQFGPLSGIRGR